MNDDTVTGPLRTERIRQGGNNSGYRIAGESVWFEELKERVPVR